MGILASCASCNNALLFWGIVLACILKTTFTAESNETPVSVSDIDSKCPGRCLSAGETCTATLNETDCEDGFICCVDHFERTTEFDWSVTTENLLDENPQSSLEFSELDETEPLDFGSDPNHSNLYSESEEGLSISEEVPNLAMSADTLEEREDSAECPGACVPIQYSEYCEYIISSTDTCAAEMTCCITSAQAGKFGILKQNEPEKPILMGRSSDFPSSRNCPGSCVHPSHAMYCNRILPQYHCPMNAKCCVQHTKQQTSAKAIECTGQCLASSMHGYCFPPNELIIGPTTCARGTTCCMRRPTVSFVEPPLPNTVNVGSLPTMQPQMKQGSPEFLGHLAIDDADNIFKVTPNGQISPLPRLSPEDHLRQAFTKLTEFDRLKGKIVIYSDSNGFLYQQFLPRKYVLFPQAKTQKPQHPPLLRQPINQFDSQASEHAATFQTAGNKAAGQDSLYPEISVGENSEVVIPDDDDEAPVTSNAPKQSSEGKLARPSCPGSCMSYFLRFTCFRGHAIYDGFTCPGRLVCCARLKDIEDHEQYLKSLSPYFNAPPAARDPNLPRCGLKGRRDTPRIVGGKESLSGEWCWQVAVINMQNQYICGGALIDNSWVLTAAHCVVGPLKEGQALFVRVGVTDLKSSEENSKSQTVRVLSTFVHHNFNNMNLDNDIALLRLQKPIELGPSVCVICLPTSGQMPKDNTKCTVTGYGFVSPGGDMSLRIREAQIPIVDDMDCITNVTEALGTPFILPSSSFCAGGQGQQDACQGDAGGPLGCEIGGFHELVGLVSWSLGCGRSDVPSIYVKVPAFMGWINQIISSSSFLMSLN